MHKIRDRIVQNRYFKKQKSVQLVSMLALVVCVMLGTSLPCFAKSVFQNENGYKVYFEDDAQLLTQDEAAKLQMEMQKITEYGNVAFKTVAENYNSTSSFADSYSYNLWKNDSGTILVIDMDNREIYISNSGQIMRTVSNSYSVTITDNIYTYASAGDYYTCASKAYEQIYTLMEGGKIAQPMKYASNALLAFVLSIIILYFGVKLFSTARKPSESELLEGLELQRRVDNFRDVFTHETRTYSPQSSGSSGGGSRRSSGGSRRSSGGSRRSGGGSRRSGGGHRF